MNTPTEDGKATGIVFNIQRFSVHDGGGIRTTVFLKGCPLRCRWCSNPESQTTRPQVARNESRCLGVEICDYCAACCPNQALLLPAAGAPSVHREKCRSCLACVGACPAEALAAYGRQWTVDAVLDAVGKDAPFYSRSRGGMTLSGGEPLLQSRFALALLREGRKRRLDCAVETCGQVDWPVLAEACGHLHELFFDIKSMDAARHEAETGLGNQRILDNFQRVATTFPGLSICVRTPVVPGVNDSEKEIGAILDFLEPYPAVRHELLAYHRLGSQKYALLDRRFPMGETRLDQNLFQRLAAMVERRRPMSSPKR